jgi:APA family basic amino acid/polyamine antiporter
MNYKKVINKKDIILIGLGYILGAGIYVIVSLASKYSGKQLWLSLLIAGIIAFTTGLGYCELQSIYKDNGGEYLYIKETFGKTVGNISGVGLMSCELVCSSTLNFALTNYITSFTHLKFFPVYVMSIFIKSIINYSGIKNTIFIVKTITYIVLLGLFLIIGLGTRFIDTNILKFNIYDSNKWTGILTASSLIFFSFLGFENMVQLYNETINPNIVLPYGIQGSTIISTILYVIIGLIIVSILPIETISTSKSPMALIGEK